MPQPELKVVLYKDNSYPRSFALSFRQLSKWAVLASGTIFLLVAMSGLLVRHYFFSNARDSSLSLAPRAELADLIGPFNSTEEQIKSLKDQVDLLQSRVKNLTALQEAPKDLDVKNPVLSLFSPNIVDYTKGQDQITAKNFSFSPGNHREPATLSFELHNNHPDKSVQKGYIVVLAKGRSALRAYPQVFNSKGPFLIDFEKGESFQVARFRMVNAQFDLSDLREPISSYQILIFKRTGELLLNLLTEVAQK